jgi:hypothetical protein
MKEQTMTMQFANPRHRPPSRWARIKHSLEGVSWFSVIALVLWFAGALTGIWGVVAEDWFSIAGGFFLETVAAVAVLFSLREDK